MMPEFAKSSNPDAYKREVELAFIETLYNIRRCYNIFDGIDNNQMPDLNTCQDGAMSRLAEVLNGRQIG